jgi:hypothetical protein
MGSRLLGATGATEARWREASLPALSLLSAWW